MKFDKFSISAIPYIHEAYCQCGAELVQVPNGLLGVALFCPKCNAVYRLELRRVPSDKVSDDYLKQCREEVARKGVR